MNADFHKFITECLGLLTENIDCSYIFLPGFYEMCNLLVRRSDYPKDYQNGGKPLLLQTELISS